jgi:hypothetical protein
LPVEQQANDNRVAEAGARRRFDWLQFAGSWRDAEEALGGTDPHASIRRLSDGVDFGAQGLATLQTDAHDFSCAG